MYISLQRYHVIKKSQNSWIQGFLNFFACWWKDLKPEPIQIITDPDRGGPKPYGSGTLLVWRDWGSYYPPPSLATPSTACVGGVRSNLYWRSPPWSPSCNFFISVDTEYSKTVYRGWNLKELLFNKLGLPEVELRFWPWFILFKYWTGWLDLSSSLCLYYVWTYRGAGPKVSLRWKDLRLNTRTQND